MRGCARRSGATSAPAWRRNRRSASHAPMTLKLLGILNITEDSFSDGGKFLDPATALATRRALIKDADGLVLGAASSKPDAIPVAPDVEIARLAPIVEMLKGEGVAVSVDTFAPEVQRWALGQDVD